MTTEWQLHHLLAFDATVVPAVAGATTALSVELLLLQLRRQLVVLTEGWAVDAFFTAAQAAPPRGECPCS